MVCVTSAWQLSDIRLRLTLQRRLSEQKCKDVSKYKSSSAQAHTLITPALQYLSQTGLRKEDTKTNVVQHLVAGLTHIFSDRHRLQALRAEMKVGTSAAENRRQ